MKEHYVIKCDLTYDYLEHIGNGYVGINYNNDKICASLLINEAMRFDTAGKAEAFWNLHRDEILENTRGNIQNPRICKIEETDVCGLNL